MRPPVTLTLAFDLPFRIVPLPERENVTAPSTCSAVPFVEAALSPTPPAVWFAAHTPYCPAPLAVPNTPPEPEPARLPA